MMPGLDKTGPHGLGPGTGRKMGTCYCNKIGNGVNGKMYGRPVGNGLHRGRGPGRNMPPYIQKWPAW